MNGSKQDVNLRSKGQRSKIKGQGQYERK